MGETCKPDGRTARAIISDCESNFRKLHKEESEVEETETVVIPMALFGFDDNSKMKILDPHSDDIAA